MANSGCNPADKKWISKIQNVTETTKGRISNIFKAINNTNEMISSIAASVEEQSIAAKDIASNVSMVSQGIDQANKILPILHHFLRILSLNWLMSITWRERCRSVLLPLTAVQKN